MLVKIAAESSVSNDSSAFEVPIVSICMDCYQNLSEALELQLFTFTSDRFLSSIDISCNPCMARHNEGDSGTLSSERDCVSCKQEERMFNLAVLPDPFAIGKANGTFYKTQYQYNGFRPENLVRTSSVKRSESNSCTISDIREPVVSLSEDDAAGSPPVAPRSEVSMGGCMGG